MTNDERNDHRWGCGDISALYGDSILDQDFDAPDEPEDDDE